MFQKIIWKTKQKKKKQKIKLARMQPKVIFKYRYISCWFNSIPLGLADTSDMPEFTS